MEDEPRLIIAKVKAVEKMSDVEIPDVAILAVKAHQASPIVDDLAQLMGPNTALIPMQNGMPWRYFQEQQGQYRDHLGETVDAGGAIMKKSILKISLDALSIHTHIRRAFLFCFTCSNS